MKSFNFLIDGPNVFTVEISAESEEEAYNKVYNRYDNRFEIVVLECICTSEPGFDRDEMKNRRFYRYGYND